MHKRCILAAVAALSITGCAQVETSEPTAQLAPAEQPEFPVGTEWTYEERGENVTWEVVSRESGNVTVSGTNGCTFTVPDGTPYAPSIKWSGCGGSTGTQQITASDGSLWPLKVGNTASWKVKGQDGQNSWSTTRRCEVEGTASLSVPAGTYNVFEVVCRDDWNTRTWFYAPSIETNVLSQRVHRQRGLQRRGELVEGPIMPSS